MKTSPQFGGARLILVFVRVIFPPKFNHLSNTILKTGLFSGIVSGFLSLSISDLKGSSGLGSENAILWLPAIVVNVLWLFGLVLSLSSALLHPISTMVQTLSRAHSAPCCTSQTRAYSGVYVRGHLDIQDVSSRQTNARAPTSFHLQFLRWSSRLCLVHRGHRWLLRSWLYFYFHLRLCRPDDVTVHIPQLSL